MVTRAQEARIESLVRAHGRVLVKPGFAGGDVEVVCENGQRIIVHPWPMGSTGMAAMVDAGHCFAYVLDFAGVSS